MYALRAERGGRREGGWWNDDGEITKGKLLKRRENLGAKAGGDLR